MSVQIDARGPRFSAAITTAVLAIALVTSSLWVISFQAVVFAIGAIRGPQFTPYALIFKKLIKPRLKSEVTFEDVRPPQFAQSVGLGFALVAVIASADGFLHSYICGYCTCRYLGDFAVERLWIYCRGSYECNSLWNR